MVDAGVKPKVVQSADYTVNEKFLQPFPICFCFLPLGTVRVVSKGNNLGRHHEPFKHVVVTSNLMLPEATWFSVMGGQIGNSALAQKNFFWPNWANPIFPIFGPQDRKF